MMIPQSKGKIFLSSQRGLTQESNNYRSYHTFNFGSYYNEHKEAIGSLLFFNDDTLNASARTKTLVKQGTSLLLLPIVGGLKYIDETSGKISGFVEAGQICLLRPDATIKVTISNPYTTELVNFLQIGISAELDQIHYGVGELDLASHPDCLLPLLFSEEGKMTYVLGSIGKFEGRASGRYSVRNPTSGVFAFVIDGVFEVQDRLLASRDGLALWDVHEVEFEALSHEAIILFLEMASQPEPLQ